MNESVFENIMNRASVRKFESKLPERDKLELIVRAGAAAPSGMNIQTRAFTVLIQAPLIDSLARAVAGAIGRGAEYDFYQPPVFIIVSEEADNQNGLANCACSLENMMLAAHALGLGSVWINQLKDCCADAQVRELLGELGVPPTHNVYGCLSLGYSAAPVNTVKKTVNVVWH